jgi:uncharacterized protein (DUF433 family)
MTSAFISHRSSDAGVVRAMASLREAFILAEISDLKTVRKDIENGWLTRSVISDNRRLWFRWVDVILLGAVYRNHHLTGSLRKRVLERIKEVGCDWTVNMTAVAAFSRTHWNVRKIYIDDCLYLDLEKVVESVGPRVDLYRDGLKKIEENSNVLGGEPVFRNTRLSVLHVGKMFERGETLENILEDYPYLEGDDVRFAQLYYRAHPAVGRPRVNAGADDVCDATGVG